MQSGSDGKNTKTLVASLIAILVAVAAVWFLQPSRPLIWTMANVNTDVLSGDAHLLRLPNGQNWLIDAGYRDFAYGRLLPGMKHHEIKHLHGVIITHAHRNHYGGLVALMESGITMDKVYFNEPDKALCDRERAGGRCIYEHVMSVFQQLREANIPVLPITPDTLYFDFPKLDLKLDTLYWFDSLETPFGGSNINDTSPLIKLSYGKTSALFPGDLGVKPGMWLAENAKDIAADILAVPHHGVRATTPNAFFDRVDAKLAMVSGPSAIFNGERGKQVRDYFAAQNTPIRVAGIEGAITISISPKGFQHAKVFVSPEYSAN